MTAAVTAATPKRAPSRGKWKLEKELTELERKHTARDLTAAVESSSATEDDRQQQQTNSSAALNAPRISGGKGGKSGKGGRGGKTRGADGETLY